jgi:hypothetical protein
MRNLTDYLNEAMFLAAESYSGSSYELGLFELTDKPCDEAFVSLREIEMADNEILAA